MRNKESIKDKITNTFLYLKSLVSKKVTTNSEITSKMELIFEDNFKFFDKDVWRVGQPWGKFQSGNPHQYYGETSVFTKDGCLVLNQIYNPKQLTTWGSDRIYDIPYSVGLITSYKSYGYGFYEFDVELPQGSGLWPAVWLSCDDSWPPEIDIIEAYSDGKGVYGQHLQSNFHFNLEEIKENSGARNHPVKNTKDKLNIACWWTKDFIKLYYNGHLVRQITSDYILKWFRDKKMTVILNNSVRIEYVDKLESQVSEFKIYSAKIWK
jgi:beta-glucanase (GH16 family)